MQDFVKTNKVINKPPDSAEESTDENEDENSDNNDLCVRGEDSFGSIFNPRFVKSESFLLYQKGEKEKSEIQHEISSDFIKFLYKEFKKGNESEEYYGASFVNLIRYIFENKTSDTVKIFFDDLIASITKLKDQLSKEELLDFSDFVNSSLFRISPSITNELNVLDQIDVYSKCTRKEYLKSFFELQAGEIVYTLNFGSMSAERLLEDFDNTEFSNKFDKLEVMLMVFAESMASGYARNTEKKLLLFFNELSKTKNKNSYFLNLYIETIIKKANIEQENPSLGVVKRRGDPNNSRLSDYLGKKDAEENEKLLLLIDVNGGLDKGQKIYRIAEDTIAILDNTNKPIKYSKIDKSIFSREPFGVSKIFLNSVIEYIKDPNPDIRFDLFSLINEKIFSKYKNREINLREICDKVYWDAYLKIMNNQKNGTRDFNAASHLIRGQLNNNYEEIRLNLLRVLEEINIESSEYFELLDFHDWKEFSGVEFDLKNKSLNSDNFETLFQHLEKPEMRMSIEDKFGISLREIQFVFHKYLLKFLCEKSELFIEKFKDFLDLSKDYDSRINRIKSFLSLDESGEDFGEKILELGESERADEIFKIYADLIDKTENIREELNGLLKNKEVELKDEHINKIVQNTLSKAAKILKDFSESIKNSGGDKEKEYYKVESLLKKYQAEVEFRGSVFRTIRESGMELDFKDIDGIDFVSETSSEFSKELKNRQKLSTLIDREVVDQMIKNRRTLNVNNLIEEYFSGVDEVDENEKNKIREILEMMNICFNAFKKHIENRKDEEIKAAENEIEELLIDFKNKILFGGEKSKIFQYKLEKENGENEIIVFFTITTREDEIKFANHYSAKSDGYGIGKSLLDTVFNSEQENIYADAYIEMCEEYLKPTYDFVIYKINNRKNKSKESYVDIKIDKNKKWKFRKADNEEIIKQIEASLIGEDFEILEFKDDKVKDAINNNLDLLENKINGENKVITRSIKYNNKIYLILENQ